MGATGYGPSSMVYGQISFLMKEQILTLEHTDDLHSLRDKIARAQAGRLVLLWPVLEKPLTRRLDLVLMGRWAAMAGSELVIVSSDEAVCRLARSAGIPCHPNLAASALAGLSTRSGTTKGYTSLRRLRRPRIAAPRNGRHRPIPQPLRVGIFSAAVLSLTAVFLLLLPSARVRAVFPTRLVDASGILDPSVCTVLNTRLTLSDRLPTSGRILAATAFATGAVTLTNISSRVLNLPVGLQVASENNIAFETLEGMILQPGKSNASPVRAVIPGSSANLPAGKVNRVLGPLALSLKAENLLPFSGGAETWRSSVTRADWDALQVSLTDQIRKEAAASLQNLAGESRTVVDKSLRVEFNPQDTPDLPVNSAADSVGLTMHATATLRACPTDWIRAKAMGILGARLLPGETLAENDLAIQLTENAQRGIDLAASGRAIEIPDRNEMVLALRAQTPAQAVSILRGRFRALDIPAISLNPAWIPLLPLFPYQIEIVAEAE
jgi:hypothetical protein